MAVVESEERKVAGEKPLLLAMGAGDERRARLAGGDDGVVAVRGSLNAVEARFDMSV